MVSGGDRLHAEVSAEGGAITLRLSGNASSPEAMGAAVAQLDAQATANQARAVTMDVTALEFMNSSSFKRIVGWLSRVRERNVDQRYTVAVRYDPQRYWQVRSLPALRSFAVDSVTLVPIGPRP